MIPTHQSVYFFYGERACRQGEARKRLRPGNRRAHSVKSAHREHYAPSTGEAWRPYNHIPENQAAKR